MIEEAFLVSEKEYLILVTVQITFKVGTNFEYRDYSPVPMAQLRIAEKH